MKMIKVLMIICFMSLISSSLQNDNEQENGQETLRLLNEDFEIPLPTEIAATHHNNSRNKRMEEKQKSRSELVRRREENKPTTIQIQHEDREGKLSPKPQASNTIDEIIKKTNIKEWSLDDLQKLNEKQKQAVDKWFEDHNTNLEQEIENLAGSNRRNLGYNFGTRISRQQQVQDNNSEKSTKINNIVEEISKAYLNNDLKFNDEKIQSALEDKNPMVARLVSRIFENLHNISEKLEKIRSEEQDKEGTKVFDNLHENIQEKVFESLYQVNINNALRVLKNAFQIALFRVPDNEVNKEDGFFASLQAKIDAKEYHDAVVYILESNTNNRK